MKTFTILAIVIVLSTPFIVKVLDNDPALNLQRKPEKTTELYFTDHLSLPKQIAIGIPYTFQFTINNLEYGEKTYSYEVIVSDSWAKVTDGKGNFVLANGQSKSIPVKLVATRSFGRMKIIVRLIDKNQEINFWVEEI